MMVTTGMFTLGRRLIGSAAYDRKPATATAIKIAMTARGLATESRVIASMACFSGLRGRHAAPDQVDEARGELVTRGPRHVVRAEGLDHREVDRGTEQRVGQDV